MEGQPLLEDSKEGYSTYARPCAPAYLSRDPSYDQLPSSQSSYYGDNYIFPPERQLGEKKKMIRTDSASSSVVYYNEFPRPHKPFFTLAVSLINVILVIYECSHGGIIKVAFAPKYESKSVDSFGCITSSSNCSSKLSETIARYSEVNVYIGPNASFLVHTGAQFTPCIREVSQIRKQVDSIIKKEHETYTCCEINGECGVYNFQTCIKTRRGKSLGGFGNCSTSNPRCYNGVTLHPCCVGLHSYCSITTQKSCEYQRGTWHKTKHSCSEVNCLEGICGMSGVQNKFKGNQGYRLITAVFIHLGIIHVIVNLLFQVPVGIMIEKRIGCVRMGLIYIISGLGGSLLSATFDPLTPVAGASGALFGLMALMLVQLVLYWRFVKQPCFALLGLIALLIISFGIGTLPYIGNFVHIGGFVFGLFASICFVPSIGNLSEGRKQWIWYARCVSFVLLVGLLILCFVVLYSIQDTQFCPWCRKLDCINWTEGLCPDLKHDGMA